MDTLRAFVIRVAVSCVCLLALCYITLRLIYTIFTSETKFWLLAKSIDDSFNVASNGDFRTYLSTRAAVARNKKKRWGCILCKLLDFVDKGHCDRALLNQ